MITKPCGEPCRLWRRLLAMVYDAVVLVAILMAAGAIALVFLDGETMALRDSLYTGYLVAIWFMYLAWCWHKGGQTLGMRAWKICIVDEISGTPGWRACGIRFCVSLLSAAAAGLGFLWSLFEPNARTWHDIASRTRLVKINSQEEKPQR